MIYKKIAFAMIPLCALLLILGGVEIFLRSRPRNTQEIEFAFFTEFKLSRWKYLNTLRERLLIDRVLETQPYTTHIDPPEANRPPFDRVPYPYEVRYNNLGFRDAYFETEEKKKKRVLVLGDSVSFGKGVKVTERYSSLVQEQFPEWEIWNVSLQGCTAECMDRIAETHFAEMKPDVLILQSSGNDIDQTLWKVASSQQIAALSVQALAWVRRVRILEYWIQSDGKHNFKQQMEQAHIATTERYGNNIRNIMSWAKRWRVPIISINLPFAYGYHYGAHQKAICAEYSKTCLNIDMQFPKQPSQQESTRDYVDFIEATAKELGFQEQELEKIFLSREYFHDVCHLSPLGHQKVAETLGPVLNSYK